jgi:hypothetical protein
LGEFGKYNSYLIYGKYLCFIIFIILLFQSNGKINRNSLKMSSIIFPFLMIILMNIIQVFNFSKYAIFETIFLLVSILPFITKAKIQFNPKLIFYLTSLAFLIKNGLEIGITISWESFLKSETSMTESNIFPFIFGFFAIFFLKNGEKKLFILSFLLTILTFKRIVFLSLVISLFIYLTRLDRSRILPYIFVLGNFLWILISYFVTTDLFYDISMEISNLPPAHLTQGRSTVYAFLFDNFKQNPVINSFFGAGATQTRIILERLDAGIDLIHNDSLKIFIDYGIPVFILFFFKLIKNNKGAVIFSVFLNILFFTDNTLIYAPVLFLFLLLSEETRTYNINKNVNYNIQATHHE